MYKLRTNAVMCFVAFSILGCKWIDMYFVYIFNMYFFNAGLVDIEIELKDKTLTFNVSPVHATIIMHFQEKGQF